MLAFLQAHLRVKQPPLQEHLKNPWPPVKLIFLTASLSEIVGKVRHVSIK